MSGDDIGRRIVFKILPDRAFLLSSTSVLEHYSLEITGVALRINSKINFKIMYQNSKYDRTRTHVDTKRPASFWNFWDLIKLSVVGKINK